MPGTVTSKWTLDTSQFDAPLKRTTDLTTASGRAIELSAQKAAQAQALAAKLSGDAVSEQTLRIIAARQKEANASSDFRKVQALNKAGYDGEVGGANLAAAALQRLTAAKLEVAEASKVQESSGASSSVEMARGLVETLALAEAFNKLREAVNASLEFGEAIQRASEKTGLAIETLSILHYAAGITGGDFDKMTTAVAKMDKTIGAATEGNKTASAFLKSLGLNATELASRTDGSEIAFRKLASTLADTENSNRRVELATGLLGRAGADQIPTLIQLGNNWDIFKQKASDAGVLLDSTTAAQLEATQQRFKDLQQKVLGASVSFTEGLIPSISAMMKVIESGKGSMDAMKAFGNEMGRIFAGVASAIWGATSGMTTFIATYELGNLTAAGRADLARAKELAKQAEEFRDIALGKTGTAAPTPITKEQSGLTPRGGFEGVGDLSGSSNKADEKRLHDMETELNKFKLQGNLSIKWEYDFWTARIASFQAGSSEYNAVIAKAANLAVEGARAAHEQIVKFQESQKRQPSNSEGDEILARFAEQQQRQAAKALADSTQDSVDSNRLAIEDAHNTARQREAELTDAAGRSITKYDAALQLAQVHAKEFAAVMQGLQGDLDAKQYQQSVTPTRENAKAVAEAQAAIAVTISQRTIQASSDQEAISGRDTSPLVGASDAIRDFVEASRDAAAQMRELVDRTLNSLNSELVKAISTRGSQRAGFADLGAGVARNVAGSALQKGEGSILGALGLGGKKKPTGAKGDPLNVFIVNPLGLPTPNIPGFSGSANGNGNGGVSGKTSSGVGSFLSGLFKNSANGSGSSSGDSDDDPVGDGGNSDSLGGIFSAIVPFLPGFASGGAISPDQWAVVGEQGPELFHSGGGGTIVPNSKAVGMGGGDTHNWNIDARGSTDTASTEATFRRLMTQAAPQIASMGVAATRERQLRMPPSRRG